MPGNNGATQCSEIPFNAYQELKPPGSTWEEIKNNLEIPINAYQELKPNNLYLTTEHLSLQFLLMPIRN